MQVNKHRKVDKIKKFLEKSPISEQDKPENEL